MYFIIAYDLLGCCLNGDMKKVLLKNPAANVKEPRLGMRIPMNVPY